MSEPEAAQWPLSLTSLLGRGFANSGQVSAGLVSPALLLSQSPRGLQPVFFQQLLRPFPHSPPSLPDSDLPPEVPEPWL